MLNKNRKYLQIALNGTLESSLQILKNIPINERIIIELGTPFIKRYGVDGMRKISDTISFSVFLNKMPILPYIVADLKCIDRGKTEVLIAVEGKASAGTVMGTAPIETINSFIEACEQYGIDAMIDMMNVEKPYQVLRKLKTLPKAVILHRGVDEERDSNKMLPIHMINKIKGTFDVMVSIAGGDTPREIQSSIFNGADIVVVWKDFISNNTETNNIAENFLMKIK